MNPSDAPTDATMADVAMVDAAAELAANPVFGDLTPSLLAAIVDCARGIDFDAGERLLSIGDPADHFWIIRSGRIDIELHDPSLGTLTIQRLDPGDILGVSWIAAPYRAEFDATAIERGSAIVVDAGELRSRCNDDAELGSELYRRFATLIRDRLHATRMQLIDLYEDS